MKLTKYTVSTHTNGIFKKESQLNDESLRQYNITANRLDIMIADIERRVKELYSLNQFDATETLKDLLEELSSIRN